MLQRESVAEEMRTLDQPARAQLRKYGVRFGAFNIYFPALLKPASRRAGGHPVDAEARGRARARPRPPCPSRRVPGSPRCRSRPPAPEAFYRVAGFHVCGPRAVRIDMLERLADLIRPLVAWRPDAANPSAPPKGATGDGGFKATPDMMSILGCSADELGNVLKALGFWAERRLARARGERAAGRPSRSRQSAPSRTARAAAADGDARSAPQRRQARPMPPEADARSSRSPSGRCRNSRCRCAAPPWRRTPAEEKVGGDLAAPAQGTRLRPAGAGQAGAARRAQGPRAAAPASARPRQAPRTRAPRDRPQGLRHERQGPCQREAPRSPPQGVPSRREERPRPQSAGLAVRAEGRLRSRFAVCGAELAQGGPGKAQPGLIRRT